MHRFNIQGSRLFLKGKKNDVAPNLFLFRRVRNAFFVIFQILKFGFVSLLSLYFVICGLNFVIVAEAVTSIIPYVGPQILAV